MKHGVQERARHSLYRWLAFLAAALALGAGAARMAALNARYPSAEIVFGDLNTPVQWNGVEFKISKGALLTYSELVRTYGNIAGDSEKAPVEAQSSRYAIFDVCVVKQAQQEAQRDYYPDCVGAEMNGWAAKNVFSAFWTLNPDYTPIVEMLIGQSQQLLFLVELKQEDFPRDIWNKLSIEKLNLVLALYPVKVVLRCAA